MHERADGSWPSRVGVADRLSGSVSAAEAGPPTRRAVWAWASVALLLCLLTIAAFATLDRLQPIPGERVPDPTFSGPMPLKGWTLEEKAALEDGRLTLRATPDNPFAAARLPLRIRPGEIAYRVEIEARLDGVMPGVNRWERARVYLLGRDQDGRPLPDRRQDLLRAAGTRDWTTYTGTVAIPSDAAAALLVIRLQRASGLLEVRRVSVQGMRAAPGLAFVQSTLLLAWSVLGIWGASLLVRYVRFGRRALALVAVGLGGLVLLLVPHELRQTILGASGQMLGWQGGTEPVAKLGHFAIFVALALLARLATPSVAALPELLLLILVAGIGEVLQFLADERMPTLRDWALNSAGALTGFLIAQAILLVLRWRGYSRWARQQDEDG